MSQKSDKKLRRAIHKEADAIKVQALQEFFKYATGQRLRKRIVFCFKIIFKRL
jgi:hypothetical protein